MTAADRPAPPAELAARVLAACQQARRPGRAAPEPPAITPVEAFSRTADSLTGVLCALSQTTWRRPVLRALTVQELIGHLLGVEHDMHRALAGAEEVSGADHVAATQLSAQAQTSRAPMDTYRDWRAAIDITVDLVAGASPAAVIGLHGLRLPLAQLLVARAFELWAHENDIRAVAGLAPSVPDDSTLALMTRLAMQMLPHAVAAHEPSEVQRQLHLVLTGAGGGTWDIDVAARIAAAPADGDPERLVIVTDAVDFCRLVANRVGPDELEIQSSGPPASVRRVLAAATHLALD